MKRHTQLLKIIVLLICCSCTSKQKVNVSTVTDFMETGKLTAQVQKIPVDILIPRAMLIVEDKLVVYKEKEEYLFDVFSLSDYTYLFSSGIRGQGPDDFLQLDTRSFQVYENEFKVMDAGNKYKTISFEDNRLVVKQSETITGFGRASNGFYPLADSIYLTLSYDGEAKEYVLYDKQKSSLTQKGDYPQWIKLDTDDRFQLFFTYLTSCVVHPDGKKFAAFYGRFKRWRIYDRYAVLLHDVDVRVPPYTKDLADEPEYYIGQPQAVGNYIFTLCSNFKKSQPDAPRTCELHIWDWSGNPIACYSFDRKISLFVVSEKLNKIFALDRLISDELYIYDLPLLNNN